MKDLENMTIKEIRIEVENMQYDLENEIKDIFKKYEFVSAVKIKISKLYLTINREDIDELIVEPIIDINI